MIRDNYLQICNEIEQITSNNGIGQSVTIVAVTKNQPITVIGELAEVGVRNFAENRVSALVERAPLMNGVRHLIGHLQTNKVKKALACADLIHSVDSLRLAQEIDRLSALANQMTQILIQVNIAKEPQKFGVYEEDLNQLLEEVSQLKNIQIRGLMAIMPIETKDEYYKRMYDLYQHYRSTKAFGIDMDILSMGMSNDYKTAVRYGSNMIRVGTALYL
ncbi:MAG: YggS family pyridoxal phosphate-dependent enzyme [Clostridia bacterium]|nr:YggS family pyridoxal phosphate-dependent enzyme [Clostridia bacterium]